MYQIKYVDLHADMPICTYEFNKNFLFLLQKLHIVALSIYNTWKQFKTYINIYT